MKRNLSRWIFLVIGISMCHSLAHAAEPNDFFESKIRPILLQHCQKCHGPEKQKGGLRLDSKAGWQTGGDSGPAIIPGKPDQSLLIRAIRYTDEHMQMPPAGKLADRDITALTEWVKQGAIDPREGGVTRLGGMTMDAAKRWWSLQPLRRSAIPSDAKQPIDAFVQEELKRQGLTPSSRADNRTLIRRATYDLTGLPPTPEEVAAFENDSSPDAFAKVVDRLLASPHYGERWGRHWLDLVRYADTAGENSDHPLPHAWRYRNWVIDAFNRDQPYDAFLRDQIAGDLLAKDATGDDYAAKIVATGFLAIARRFGHDIDKDIHLTHEDVIDTLGKTTLGLSIGCARCHDHKYDPISARDYYALYGIFDSTRFAFPGCEPQQQPRDLIPLLPANEWAKSVQPYQERLAAFDRQLQAIDNEQQTHIRELKTLATPARGNWAKGEIADGGEQTFASKSTDSAKPLTVRAGQMVQLVVNPRTNHGGDTTLVEWEITEVGGAKRRWNLRDDLIGDLLAGNPHADQHGHRTTWWFFDGRTGMKPLPEAIRDASGKAGLHVWRNGDTPSVLVNATEQPISVWTKLPARSVFVHPAANGPVIVGWVSPIEGQVTISGRIADAHPGGPDGIEWAIDHLAVDLTPHLTPLATIESRRAEIASERLAHVARAPKQEVAFAVTEGKAHDAPLHMRGDPEKPGPIVPRRWLEILGGQPVPPESGSGRLQLANWLTDPKNPLTARVMVNRIWQHHFGRGLVSTPNDFGTRGQLPTHPALLDWLAMEFIESGWSIKTMHRHIMLSATYQQSSDARPDALERDANNVGYWRFDRRRLTAEELRDSLLWVSGQLDRSPAGPHPFPPESSWSFTQHNPFSTFFESDRRSVYLVSLRNRRHPFLGLFDGADPNATTPQRQVTTVPTQALYFLNDPFYHAQAARLTDRILTQPDDAARLDELFRILFQRVPTDRDRKFATAFRNRYEQEVAAGPESKRDHTTWMALTRVLLASNEFLYLD